LTIDYNKKRTLYCQFRENATTDKSGIACLHKKITPKVEFHFMQDIFKAVGVRYSCTNQKFYHLTKQNNNIA
jgi:hypothetical protein